MHTLAVRAGFVAISFPRGQQTVDTGFDLALLLYLLFLVPNRRPYFRAIAQLIYLLLNSGDVSEALKAFVQNYVDLISIISLFRIFPISCLLQSRLPDTLDQVSVALPLTGLHGLQFEPLQRLEPDG